jgi:hypothetical protein
VGKSRDALDYLFNFLVAKHGNRPFQKSYQDVMFKFVDLCVVERASKEAREGLNEYKKLTEKVWSRRACCHWAQFGGACGPLCLGDSRPCCRGGLRGGVGGGGGAGGGQRPGAAGMGWDGMGWDGMGPTNHPVPDVLSPKCVPSLSPLVGSRSPSRLQ